MSDTKTQSAATATATDKAEGSSRRAVVQSRGVRVRVENLSVSYGEVRAVSDVSLNIEPGELYFLLGPSGCGKTTLLRAIAGLAEIGGGRIHFGDERVDTRPAHGRGAAMVFQNYALWPHMTVQENVAYGLEVRKVEARELRKRVEAALEMVGLEKLAARRPGELSGGQQQRVALARALVVEPGLLLLDEPLSNLDAKLRGEMRREIREVVRRTGVTALYVTHDQREGLSMADRLAVMDQGRLVQEGTPGNVYRHPRTPFVATFLGEANRFGGRIVRADADEVIVDSPLGQLKLSPSATKGLAPTTGAELPLFVRPECVRLGATRRQGAVKFKAVVGDATFLGECAHFTLVVKADGEDVLPLGALQYNPRGVLLDEGREVDAFIEMVDIGIIGALGPDAPAGTGSGSSSM